MLPTMMSLNEVIRQTTLSRSTIWRLQKAKMFPEPLRISTSRIAFRRSDIEAWLAARERVSL